MFPASTGKSATAEVLFSLFGIDRKSSSDDFTFPDIRRGGGRWEQPGGTGWGVESAQTPTRPASIFSRYKPMTTDDMKCCDGAAGAACKQKK